jgi:hypothetical protein
VANNTPLPADKWHLKREVQLSHIITTLAVAVSVAVYVQKIETRLALVELALIEQRERDKKQDQVAAEVAAAVHNKLEKMDNKLDRLIERQMR